MYLLLFSLLLKWDTCKSSSYEFLFVQRLCTKSTESRTSAGLRMLVSTRPT